MSKARGVPSAAGGKSASDSCRNDSTRSASSGGLGLPAQARLLVKPGQTIVSFGTGGGGFGRPTDRPPGVVAESLRDGLITEVRAREVGKRTKSHEYFKGGPGVVGVNGPDDKGEQG